MKYGHQFGLIPDNIYNDLQYSENLIKKSIEYFKSAFIPPKDVNPYLARVGGTELKQPDSVSQIIKRNEININDVLNLGFFEGNEIINELKQNPQAVNQVEIELKYEGYIKRQGIQASEFEENEKMEIPVEFDFSKVKSLSTEGREKLSKVRPRSIGQASRIAGVSPSDVSILTIHMKS